MDLPQTLTLRMNTEQLEAFCRHLATHAPGSEQHLAALTALQSFIAAGAGPDEQARPAYQTARQTLERHIEQARARLLQAGARQLLLALQQRDAAAIAALYRPLSRSGFWEVMTQAAAMLDDDSLAAVAQWARHWLADARQRGEQASGFPDAIDFHKAGIDVAQYTALDDVQRCIGGLLP